MQLNRPIIVVLIVFIVSPSAYCTKAAGEKKAGTLIENETFDGGHIRWIRKGRGESGVKNGLLYFKDDDRSCQWTFNGSQKLLQNLRVDMDIKFLANKNHTAMGIGLRQKGTDAYSVTITPDKTSLSRKLKGNWKTLISKKRKLSLNRWHSVSVKINGSWITFRMNGKEIFKILDSMIPQAGKVGFGGVGPIAVDNIKIVKFPETMQVALVPKKDGLGILALEGLYYHIYRCSPEELKVVGATRIESSFLSHTSKKDTLTIPLEAEKILPLVNVVLMVNIDADALKNSGFNTQLLYDFVQKGGGLVILGGQFSFGGGGYKGTVFEKLCPVEVKSPFDRIQAKPPLLMQATGTHPIVQGLDFSEKLLVVWYHDITVKPDSRVILEASGKPIVVVRRVGKGRVVAFLGTVLGETNNGTAFWKTRMWRKLLKRMLFWAAGKETSDNK